MLASLSGRNACSQIREQDDGFGLTRDWLSPYDRIRMLQTLLSTWAPATHWPRTGDFALRAVHRRVGMEVLIAGPRRGRRCMLLYVNLNAHSIWTKKNINLRVVPCLSRGNTLLQQ